MEDKASDATAVLIGMPDFVVQAATEEDGEVWLLVETVATVMGCAGCGTRAKAKGRRDTPVRSVATNGHRPALHRLERKMVPCQTTPRRR